MFEVGVGLAVAVGAADGVADGIAVGAAVGVALASVLVTLARRSQRSCRMRFPILAVASALLPLATHAQLAPRSLALELGFSTDSVPALGSRAPVALVASWWLGGDVDALARISWASAARTGGRSADATYEAGVGLRRQLLRCGPLRPHVGLELAAVGVTSSPGWIDEAGLRLALNADVEALLGRDLFLAVTIHGSELMLPGGGGLGGYAAVRAGAYF